MLEPEIDLDVLSEAVETVETVKTPINVTQDIEYAEETKSYTRAMFDIELRKQALQQEAKDLKEEFKDQGVDIKSATSAARELAKRTKQTSEEADQIERTIRMFEQDDGIYSTIVALTA